jgi:hypothetical protein
VVVTVSPPEGGARARVPEDDDRGRQATIADRRLRGRHAIGFRSHSEK